MTRRTKNNIPLVLGATLWLAAAVAVGGSAYTVAHRMLRPTTGLRISAPKGHGLAPGDTVFLATDNGLRRVGEVGSVRDDTVTLSIDQGYGDLAGTQATCWQTPLSAEETVSALLPPEIQEQAAAHIAQAWRDRGDELTEIWKPIAADLAVAYIKMIGAELGSAVQNHSEDIQAISKKHMSHFGEDWPLIQQRLRPILQEHLTPTLSRLAGEALADAPKTQIAWNIIRGHHAAAYELMLDWLGEWMADMPEDDHRELHDALRETWDAARQDKELGTRLGEILRRLHDDKQIHRLLADIYRETMTENSRTADFLRERLIDDPHMRQEVYRTLELLGPTLKSVLATTLFDRNGTTRPEIVHLVRSVALRREVAWVTLRAERGDK